jgi:ankyrin repeat protein
VTRKRILIIAATFASLFATTAVGVAIFLHFCPHYIMFRSCSPMLKAVLANDAAEIRRLAAAGEPLETRFSTWNQSSFERDATPLLLAALHGHSDAAIALIELGADVNAANEFRRSVCLYLIVHDNDVALAMALERGVNDPEFGQPHAQLTMMLMFAESNGAKRCAQVLDAAQRSKPY